jgi:hypothetical protein
MRGLMPLLRLASWSFTASRTNLEIWGMPRRNPPSARSIAQIGN